MTDTRKSFYKNKGEFFEAIIIENKKTLARPNISDSLRASERKRLIVAVADLERWKLEKELKRAEKAELCK